MQGAGGGGWSRLRAPSFEAGGRRGAAAEEAAGTRSGSQYSSAPAEAGICSRLICPRLAQTRTCRVSVIWVHCCRGHTSQPPLGPPRSLSRAPWLCLCPPGSGSSCGCGCDYRSRLLSSLAAPRDAGDSELRAGLAEGVKLRPTLGSGENLLTPGMAQGCDGWQMMKPTSGQGRRGVGRGGVWSGPLLGEEAGGLGGLLKRNSQKLAWEWSCRPPRGQSLGV